MFNTDEYDEEHGVWAGAVIQDQICEPRGVFCVSIIPRESRVESVSSRRDEVLRTNSPDRSACQQNTSLRRTCIAGTEFTSAYLLDKYHAEHLAFLTFRIISGRSRPSSLDWFLGFSEMWRLMLFLISSTLK